MTLRNEDDFRFDGRTRRPPLDPVNAMLSFVYTLLGNEISGALESVGLDLCVGFMHTLRPGRSSLSLDIKDSVRFYSLGNHYTGKIEHYGVKRGVQVDVPLLV